MCAEERERRQGWEGEKWVPCVERYSSSPMTCEGNMLERVRRYGRAFVRMRLKGCEAAGTYFKTWLYVLVKARSDSSTTGDLSWTQPSRETGELSSHTPSLVPSGPLDLASRTGCPVNTGLTGAMLFISIPSILLCHALSPSVSVSVSFSPCPFAPQKTAGVLQGCQEKEGPHLFHCLSFSVPE